MDQVNRVDQVGLEHPKPTTAMDCAGRYTTQGPTKRVRFLEEIQWWHDWWKNLHVCTSSDIQKHFYNLLGAGMSTCGADDYVAEVQRYITLWQDLAVRISMRSPSWAHESDFCVQGRTQSWLYIFRGNVVCMHASCPPLPTPH